MKRIYEKFVLPTFIRVRKGKKIQNCYQAMEYLLLQRMLMKEQMVINNSEGTGGG